MFRASSQALVALSLVGCSAVLGLDDLTYEDQPTTGGSAGSGNVGAGEGGTGAGGLGGIGADGGMPGGGGIGGGGAPVGGGGASCGELDDEFDVEGLDCWDLGPENARATESWEPGVLVVETIQLGAWYQQDRSWALFKEITGNFAVATAVVTESIDTGLEPDDPFNSAGLLARDPASVPSTERWILHSIGHQSATENIGTLSKSQTDPMFAPSANFIDTSGVASGRLLMCRIGADFTMWTDTGSGWLEGPGVNRPDLPATLQVGIMVDAYANDADLHAEFDYVRFADTPPSVPNDCTAGFPP